MSTIDTAKPVTRALGASADIRDNFARAAADIDALTGALQELSATIAQVTTVEDYGAAGDGSTDDTVAIQAALATEDVVRFTPGRTYKITQTLFPKTGNQIIGNGAILSMPAANFNNSNPAVGSRYGSNSVAVYAHSVDNILIENLKFVGPGTDGTVLRPLTVRGVNKGRIDNVEVTGFATGVGIGLSNNIDVIITRCSVHTWYTNLDWGGTGMGQTTGIEIDNDQEFDVQSRATKIDNCDIYDMVQGPVAIAASGHQSDGINIVGDAFGTAIANCRIRNVGDGFDNTGGQYTTLTNCHFEDCYNFGIKIVHGSSYGTYSNCTIRNTGLCGIGVGSSSTLGDVAYNNFSNIVIEGIDPNGVWAVSTPNCIQMTHSTNDLKYNSFNNVTCLPGSGGEWVMLLRGSTGGPNFYRLVMPTRGSIGWVEGSAAGDLTDHFVSAIDATNVQVSLGGAQTISSASDTLIEFDTESIDSRGEFDTTTHLWTCQVPGRYRVVLQSRTAIATAQATTFRIKEGANTVAQSEIKPSDTAQRTFPIIDCEFYIREGGTVSATAAVASGSFDLSASTTAMYMIIRPA